ncbi:hypothetical protein BGX38DRAFT_1273897 [Terfezia claveryi]|nr:hypothetical protein BGX38DRAFT_1273897 [Terfezia claveryi]
MSTNSQVEDSLIGELMEFLRGHGVLTYGDGITGSRCGILMGCRLAELEIHTLIKLIVEEWMKDGIIKMSELPSTYAMTPAVTVQEHVRANLILLEVYKH